MKVFECEFNGHFLGGTATIVARSKPKAREILEAKLADEGLLKKNRAGGDIVIVEIDTGKTGMVHFYNGDY